MKSYLLSLIIIFGITSTAFAQVGINTDDPKSTLDIHALNLDSPDFSEGILVPRIDEFPATDPGVDHDGLLVFLTTATGTYTKGFHYWNNGASSWIRVGEFGNEWLPGRNASGDSLIYARRSKLNGTDIVYTDAGRIGVGTDDPVESIELRSNGDNDFQLTSANVNPPNMIFLNTGGTVDSPTALATDQEIGSIIVKTNDGNQLVEVGGFRFYVDGTPSVGSVPSSFILSNTPDGSISQIDRFILKNSGNIGLTVDDPTATLHIRAGTASSGSAPIKLSSGTNLSTPEAGAIEFDGTNLYFTPSTERQVMFTGFTKAKTLDFPAISAASTSELSFTVPGATIGSSCSCSPTTGIEAGLSWNCYVSAANTVTLRLSNVTSGSIDPANGSWKITVID